LGHPRQPRRLQGDGRIRPRAGPNGYAPGVDRRIDRLGLWSGTGDAVRNGASQEGDAAVFPALATASGHAGRDPVHLLAGGLARHPQNPQPRTGGCVSGIERTAAAANPSCLSLTWQLASLVDLFTDQRGLECHADTTYTYL